MTNETLFYRHDLAHFGAVCIYLEAGCDGSIFPPLV